MINLKTIDRLALMAMLSTTLSISLASCAAIANPAPAPDAKITLKDGIERRFYTSGPMGTTTYRVDVAADGTVLARKQVLEDGVLQTIRAGMTADEVFALIGPPSSKERFARTQATAWNYHVHQWGYDSDFAVIVDDAGIVTSKVNVRNGN
jgi:outer membrane protein assembly factor BamE (lipoprotein component of BamABCDE complex)